MATLDPYPGLLLPRLRRLLSVGALLDETIVIFREHWRTMAVVNAIALLPLALLPLALTPLGLDRLLRSSFVPTARFDLAAPLIAGFAVYLVIAIVIGGAWSAAMTAAADSYFRGRVPRLAEIYATGFKRMGIVVLSSLVFALLAAVLTAVATLIFIVTVFGAIGSLAAIIALVYWWRRPRGRTPILKWLIILATPYGLLAYYLTRWSLFVPGVVLERRGPIDSIQRSAQLVSGEWFRVGAIVTVEYAIVFVLSSAPSLILLILIELVGASGSPFEPDPVRTFVSNIIAIMAQVPFAGLWFLGSTLTFIDLRNRREGTDLAERITAAAAGA
jgi:hypothetical protein